MRVSPWSWFLLLLTLAYVAWCWLIGHTPPPFFPVSENQYIYMFGEYSSFNAFRSAGYPVFIDVVRFAFGTVDAIPRVQLVLYAGATGFLSWSIFHVFRTP